MTGRRQRKGQRGIAMVEFAIVLPLMLLLMLGVTELGRAMLNYNTLTKAVRDGARHASAYALLGTTGSVNVDAALENEVRNLVVYGNTAGQGAPVLEGLTAEHVTVTADGALQVRVDAAFPYAPVFGDSLPNFGLGSPTSMTFTMQASVRMRAL